MARFYVDGLTGNDTTGDGTAANPWATIGKAIGSTPAVTLSGSGLDEVFIAPGTYFEVVTLGPTPSSGNPLRIAGDADGAGFLAGGVAAPRTGIVEWWGWTNSTTVANSPTLTIGGKSYVTLDRLKIHGGNSSNNGSCLHVTGVFSNINVRDSILVCHPGAGNAVMMREMTGPIDSTFERCTFQGGAASNNAGLVLSYNEAATEFSLNAMVQNCTFTGVAYGMRVVRNSSGPAGGAKSATGVTVRNNDFWNLGSAIQHGDNFTLTAPISVVGNKFYNCSTGINAQNTTVFAEDYNAFACSVPRNNTTAGANSSTTLRFGMDHGDGRLTGVPLQPRGTPTPGSPLGGFLPSGFPAEDNTGRRRPEGLGSTIAAAGCLERHDTGVRNAAYQDSGSTACLELAGPSSQERPLLVDAVATTVSVKVRWDGDHGDANRPLVELVANPEIGVAGQAVAATGAGGSGSTPNAYQTLTFAPFTPTGKGVVMLRFVSRSAAGAGKAYFDTIGIA